MKKIFQIFLLAFSLFIASCSSDDNFAGNKGNGTSVTVKIMNNKGLPVSNTPVYAFSAETWVKNGGEAADLILADFKVNTNNSGIAVFNSLDKDIYFNANNNYTNAFVFVIEYKLEGNSLRKVEQLTVMQNSYSELAFVL